MHTCVRIAATSGPPAHVRNPLIASKRGPCASRNWNHAVAVGVAMQPRLVIGTGRVTKPVESLDTAMTNLTHAVETGEGVVREVIGVVES